MTENANMIIFYENIVDGEPKLFYYSAPTATAGFSVRMPNRPGIGNKYWAFPTFPVDKSPDDIMDWSFQGAPVSSANVNTNNANITAITQTADDVFTWYPVE